MKEFADRVDSNHGGRDQQNFVGNGLKKTQGPMHLRVEGPPLLQRATLNVPSRKLYHLPQSIERLRSRLKHAVCPSDLAHAFECGFRFSERASLPRRFASI